jgi:hypothetical protein
MPLIHDSIAFHNVAELEPVAGLAGLRLQRFPEFVREHLGFKSHSRGRFMSHRAAGCELRFVTEGAFVRISLSALECDTMVVVYKGDHAHSRHYLPAGVVTSLFLEDPPWFAQVDATQLQFRRFAPNVWRVMFHQDAVACFHHLDPFCFPVRPPGPDETPALTWLAYGSSITFGGNAFHPSNAYVQHAANLLKVDVLCKGMPGSCLCEPEVGAYLAGLPGWDFATLELGVNLVDWATPDEFEILARNLIATVHAARPDAPVFVIDIFPNRANHLLDRDSPAAIFTPLFNAIIPRLVTECAHRNVRLIDGRTVLADFSGLSSDLLHPSDQGHIAMGDALARLLGSVVRNV